jgi:hypothetical protein
LGIKVFLKPQVDLIDYSVWRGELAPSSVSDWFASYQAYIVHYAQLAQQYNVDGFSIGTELKSLSGSDNLPYWESLISAVRAAYSGPIVYGANATGADDEFTTVSFWSLVDIIGVDGYFGLTDQDDPTVSQLESAWTDSSSTYTGAGFNAVTALKDLASKYSKPLVFAEIGYESTAGTNEQPYNYGLSDGYDPTEQAACYTAFFEVFSQQTSWMKGVFWVDLQLPVPGAYDPGYVMYGKPAGTVMTQWYGGANYTLAPTAPTLSVTQGSNATDTITVTPADGFTGSVTLAATGLPTGVTATFAPNPATSTSVLTLTATSTATVGGPVAVTITGTSGTLTASTAISLTVTAITPPGFTLWASPASLTVVQGSNGSSNISVTGAGGFTGSVTLAAPAPLPEGVTAAFATNPTTGSSVLTLTASSTATVGGPVTVTISGTSGLLSATTTIALTVTGEPTFAVSGPAITVAPGATTGNTSTITVAPSNGFTGTINLSCSISPTAASNPATCSLSPASVTISGTTTQTSMLTVTTMAATSAENRTKRLFWPSAGGTALAVVFFFGIPRRRNWLAMLGLLVFCVSLGAMGCGGSSSGGGNSGTTPGMYTVVVAGTSGTTTETATVTLTVQ